MDLAPSQSVLAPEELLTQLRWRYATKRFDPQRRIDDATWSALEDALVLAPSSYGLQPWRFLVIDDPDLRSELRTVSMDQPQIVEASHLVVFAASTVITEQDVDGFVERTAEVRGVPVASLDAFRQTMIGDVVDGPRALIAREWAARQAYIALGVLLSSAAMLGIDACPMEGFDPAGYDRILGLEDHSLRAVVLATLGYRRADDKHAAMPKVRFTKDQVVEHR
ncbi:MAG: NAD(P)H-dependent oxidoreductase [Planctomycetes bacterium]|nr:NAD(P)H-dependent oxidoreductase [Planctomycetota bacterium]